MYLRQNRVTKFLHCKHELRSRSGSCLSYSRVEIPGADGHSLLGDFRLFRDVESKILGRKRDVIVSLPAGYQDSQRSYPLLIMHDGQNLFDGNTSFIRGQEWGFDETAHRLVAANATEPVVIAGVYNTGEFRIEEYSPTRDPGIKRGGKGAAYGKFLVKELLPLLHNEFRLQKGPEVTGLGGSSLGGLITLSIGLDHPEVFGKLAVMSPSLWWDRKSILRRVAELPGKLPLKIWLDVGTNESGDPGSSARHVHNAELARDSLCQHGWILGHDLVYYAGEGHDHTERSFGIRVEPMLRFLFPKAD
jgi:predicted alpha/beta superfamily hydrolase